MEERHMAEHQEGSSEERLGNIVAQVYTAFELVALAALSTAVLLSVYDFFESLVSEGFNHVVVLEKVLAILVFIDLTRTLVSGLVEGRFRMDVLLEAITIAVARDLIGALALIKESFNPVMLATLTGMLAVSTLLWWVARRVERQEPGPRLRPRRSPSLEGDRSRVSGASEKAS